MPVPDRTPQEPPEEPEDMLIDAILTALPFLELLHDAADYDTLREQYTVNGQVLDYAALLRLIGSIHRNLPSEMYPL